MNVPDSILDNAESKVGDPFMPTKQFIQRDPKEIYDFLKFNLNDDVLSKLLESSFHYYKRDVASSKDMFRNLFSLFLEYTLDKIKNSSIDDDKKNEVLDFCRTYFKIFNSQSDMFCDLLDFLGKNQIILEPKEIIIIILGYATGTLKKIYSN